MKNRLIGQVGRVFANGPGDLGFILGRVIPKALKCYLIPPCLTLNNIRYMSRVKLSNPRKGDIWQTDCKPRTASTSFVWLPFSVNTITFTYHPLFELFFHRSYLKTTTDMFEEVKEKRNREAFFSRWRNCYRIKLWRKAKMFAWNIRSKDLTLNSEAELIL